MRVARVLALLVAVSVLPITAFAADAADFRTSPGSMRPISTPPPARTPSVLKGPDPGLERFDRHRDRPGHQRPIIVVPQTVFVNPGRCWQPGYWTYQYVPQTYAYSTDTWVPGQWSADGTTWIDGYYAPAYYNGGAYQPIWVDGYYTSCQ